MMIVICDSPPAHIMLSPLPPFLFISGVTFACFVCLLYLHSHFACGSMSSIFSLSFALFLSGDLYLSDVIFDVHCGVGSGLILVTMRENNRRRNERKNEKKRCDLF